MDAVSDTFKIKKNRLRQGSQSSPILFSCVSGSNQMMKKNIETTKQKQVWDVKMMNWKQAVFAFFSNNFAVIANYYKIQPNRDFKGNSRKNRPSNIL